MILYLLLNYCYNSEMRKLFVKHTIEINGVTLNSKCRISQLTAFGHKYLSLAIQETIH